MCVCMDLQHRNPAEHLTWPDINHCALSHAIFTWLSTAGAGVVWVWQFFVSLFPLFQVLFQALSAWRRGWEAVGVGSGDGDGSWGRNPERAKYSWR